MVGGVYGRTKVRKITYITNDRGSPILSKGCLPPQLPARLYHLRVMDVPGLTLGSTGTASGSGGAGGGRLIFWVE